MVEINPRGHMGPPIPGHIKKHLITLTNRLNDCNWHWDPDQQGFSWCSREEWDAIFAYYEWKGDVPITDMRVAEMGYSNVIMFAIPWVVRQAQSTESV